jgi:hypothetical protein
VAGLKLASANQGMNYAELIHVPTVVFQVLLSDKYLRGYMLKDYIFPVQERNLELCFYLYTLLTFEKLCLLEYIW